MFFRSVRFVFVYFVIVMIYKNRLVSDDRICEFVGYSIIILEYR